MPTREEVRERYNATQPLANELVNWGQVAPQEPLTFQLELTPYEISALVGALGKAMLFIRTLDVAPDITGDLASERIAEILDVSAAIIGAVNVARAELANA